MFAVTFATVPDLAMPEAPTLRDIETRRRTPISAAVAPVTSAPLTAQYA
jgi:hypothetical protein